MRRLLIRPGGIGDCLLSFPALQFLRAEYAEIWISTPVVPLVTFADSVHSIASTGLDMVGIGDRSIEARLCERLQSFDEIHSWYGTNREEFRCAMNGLEVRCHFHQALPTPDSSLHAADFYSRQVGGPEGRDYSFRFPALAKRDTIVIHPYSGSARKNWPLSRFRALADLLPRAVEWAAGPEETSNEANRFENLRDLAIWISGAALYVGNDSGITHLAAAVGVPTLALFGHTEPHQWAPRGPHVRVLRHQSLTELLPEVVLAAVLDSQ